MKRKGVSTIVGAAIFVAIVFMVIVPLLLYMQSTAEIYQREAQKAYRKELDKLREGLEVHASVEPSTYQMVLVMDNLGDIAVKLKSVCYTKYSGTSSEADCYDEVDLNIPPQTPCYRRLDFFDPAQKEYLYYLKAVSERGRVYTAPEKLNLTSPPYNLYIALIDMNYDHKYEATVTVEPVDALGSFRVGCVYDPQTGECASSASKETYAYTFNQNETLIFRVFPGKYQVTVVKKSWTGTEWVEEPDPILRQTVFLKNDMILPAPDEHQPATPIGLDRDFKITIEAPATVLTSNDYPTATINVYVALRLVRNATEALRDLQIDLTVTDSHFVSYSITPSTPIHIERIRPGQTVVLNYTVQLTSTSPFAGGYIVFQARLLEATGERTETNYLPGGENKPSEEYLISVCKLSTLRYIECAVGTCDRDYCEDVLRCDWIGPSWLGFCVCETNVIPRCGLPD